MEQQQRRAPLPGNLSAMKLNGGGKHIYFCFVANDPMSHKQLITKYDHDLLRGFNPSHKDIADEVDK